MIFKMYREKAAMRPDDKEMERIYKGFQKIYEKYGVKVIGAWENVDEPRDICFITAYQDNTHYEETVAKMRTDLQYQELTKELETAYSGERSVEVVTWKLMPGSPE